MTKVKNESKRKLKEILDDLENHKSITSEKWKLSLKENKGRFDEIKRNIKEKQEELKSLVTRKKTLSISEDEFTNKTQKIQDELYELESEILKLRLQNR